MATSAPIHDPLPLGEVALESRVLGLVASREPSLGSVERTEQLAREQLRFVWRLARRLGLSPSDADDATQRVFFVVVERIDRIHPGSERAFLYRTALRIALKIKAASRRAHQLDGAPDLELLPHSGPSPEDLSEQQRARALLDRILDSMPLDLREVLILFEIEHLSMQEVAELLEVPRGTVASRLRRARADFEQRLHRLQVRASFKGVAP
ncbi:MAG TPA: sigma-70 family RNA polymerase sigma factor [Polyangiaceae bacterium]